MKLPENFLIGAATAAHQVEGNNIHSDLWAMEHMKHTSFIEPSLDAVDHYNRYEKDIKLMADAGLNAYRFSIEWARIEPEEGHFDSEAVDHYKAVIACCKKYGIEPFVTLHHFSSPKWLISKGGWEASTTPEDFAHYVRFIIGELGSELHYICTINEANMGIQVAAIAERYKRQMMAQMQAAQSGGNSADGSVQVGINLQKMMEGQKAAAAENLEVFGVEKVENFTSMRTREGDLLILKAHELAKKEIKALYPDIKVGLTLSLHDIQPQEDGMERAKKEWDEEFMHYLPYIKDDDFLGVQNYTRSLIGADGQLPNPDGAELTQMNYEFYPEALEHVLRKVAKDFHGDLYVTALKGIVSCINDGLPVKSYFHWSLLDNFEWQKGYSMTFGLIAVDRSTQTRHPKESLSFLGHWNQ